MLVDPVLGGGRLDVERDRDLAGEQRARSTEELLLARGELRLRALGASHTFALGAFADELGECDGLARRELAERLAST